MEKEIKKNGYNLSRNWFDWTFENPEKVKPIHTAIYFYAVERSNRLGWKNKFGFPSYLAMETLGVKNWSKLFAVKQINLLSSNQVLLTPNHKPVVGSLILVISTFF